MSKYDSPKPAAWLAFATDGSESSAVYMTQEKAQAAANDWGWSIVPLYRKPQPTLTDEERAAVETAALEAEAHQHADRAATLRGLLERLA